MADLRHFEVPHPAPGLTDLQVQQNFQALAREINKLIKAESPAPKKEEACQD